MSDFAIRESLFNEKSSLILWQKFISNIAIWASRYAKKKP